jgi:hypothetical protein
VTHCITVSGVGVVAAMLLGDKKVENRSFRMSEGWYGLHCGKSLPDKKVLEILDMTTVERSPVFFSLGEIAGFIKISGNCPPQFRTRGTSSAQISFYQVAPP